MKTSQFLAVVFGLAGTGLAVHHYVLHGARVPETRELYFIASFVVLAAFLADPEPVGRLIKSIWPFGRKDDDGERGT
jgi:hypothetical protein